MQNVFSSLSILSLLDCSEAERKSFVEDVLTRMEQGEIPPAMLRKQLQSAQAIVEALLSDDRYTALTQNCKGNEQEHRPQSGTITACP